MDMEYDDILQTLCDVWEKVKEVMRKFAERLREICRTIKGTFRKLI